MALLDLLGRRWALRILWELRSERMNFRALRDACDGVSPTVLNDRLKQLREARLVDVADSDGYGLTPLGRELAASLSPLLRWSHKWARAFDGDLP
jgi:DNA-binding HxlR family transcriptional regulator